MQTILTRQSQGKQRQTGLFFGSALRSTGNFAPGVFFFGRSIVLPVAGLVGVPARQCWQGRGSPPHYGHYLALGVVVQLMQLAAFTQVLDRAGYAFIEQAWWVLLFYPLAAGVEKGPHG